METNVAAREHQHVVGSYEAGCETGVIRNPAKWPCR